RSVEWGCARVPRIVIAEVLAGARFESRSRHQRIVRGLALEAPSGEREIRPRRQQNTAAGPRFLLQQRQRKASSDGIADERYVLRAKLSDEAAICRPGVVEHGRERMLRSEPIVRD